MIVASAGELSWQRIELEEWHEGWESRGWRIVDAEWVAWMEERIWKSDLWKKSDAESNEYLGRVILWFYAVRDEFERR